MKTKNIRSFIDYGNKNISTDWMLIPIVVSAIETFISFLFLDDINRIYILAVNVVICVASIIGYIYITKMVNYTKEVDFLCSGIYILEFCFCSLSISYLFLSELKSIFHIYFLFLLFC